MFLPVFPVALFVALFLATRVLLQRGVLTTQRTAGWRGVRLLGIMILIWPATLLNVSNSFWFHSEGLNRAAAVSIVLGMIWTIYWLIRV